MINKSFISHRLLAALFLNLALVFGFSKDVQAQVYEKIFSFTDARNDETASGNARGSMPLAALVQGADGNFYGTTYKGGTKDGGTVFRMTPDGVVTTLVDFTGQGATMPERAGVLTSSPKVNLTGEGEFGGRRPSARLLALSDGSLFGTTAEGGTFGQGTLFKVTAGGVFTSLEDFEFGQVSPRGGLIRGGDGSLYGTTVAGAGPGVGSIFKKTPGMLLADLAYFGEGVSGTIPVTSLIADNNGNFYGTTVSGGISNFGTVYRVTPSGVLTTLLEFTGTGTTEASRGSSPSTDLIVGADGNFYGTTYSGGANNAGTVFKMTPAGAVTTLYDFPREDEEVASGEPTGMVLGNDGNFYITLKFGGLNGTGSILRMTLAGVVTELFSFGERPGGPSAPGINPVYPNGMVLGADGNFYGTTQQGGMFDSGTVFRMTPSGVVTPLVEFTGQNPPARQGLQPIGGLIAGDDGNFYGTTAIGGADNLGTFFQVTPTGVVTTLADVGSFGSLVKGIDGAFYGFFRDFENPNGSFSKMTTSGVLTRLSDVPLPGPTRTGLSDERITSLVRDDAGDFYGTTETGGVNGNGSIFKITPAGVLTTLVDFDLSNGGGPGGLVLGPDGNFYGLTKYGDDSNTNGSFFKMTPAGMLTKLLIIAEEGSYFSPALTLGPDGNFYGQIGTMISKITPSGELTVLADPNFDGMRSPNQTKLTCPLVLGSDGKFYGKMGFDTPIIFQLTTDGTPGATTLTVIREFVLDDPYAGERAGTPLVAGNDGNLYGSLGGIGILELGGPIINDSGSLFRLILPGAPNLYPRDALVTDLTSASLTTFVNARGGLASVWLEYGTDGITFPNSVLVSSAVTGYETAVVGTTITGLNPAARYYYRFRADSPPSVSGTFPEGGVTTIGPVQSFTTGAHPFATPTPASAILATSAQFNGTVRAFNSATTVTFEWGTDGSNFPNKVTATPKTVNGSGASAVRAPVAGLSKGSSYFYRIVATNLSGTTVSGQIGFVTLTEPVATVGAASAVTSQSATFNGTVNALGAPTSVVFEYGTEPGIFPNSVGATPAKANGNSPVAVSRTLSGLTQGATYYYRVKATSAGGVGFSSPASLTLDSLSSFERNAPELPFDAQGFVLVTLTPSGVGSWRFTGEQQWRPSGIPVAGLTTGDRNIEYRPVPGYVQPLAENVSIVSGGAPSLIERVYYETPTSGSGGISVTLKPESLTLDSVSQEDRAQWRLLGEDDDHWRNSGASLTGLAPGNYLVECKPVIGRTTPPNGNVLVQDLQTAVPVLTYFQADAVTGTPPSPIPFETVSTDTTTPYAHVGQIRSNVGSSSGFVVKPRVVATAGHVVFDDGALAAVTGLQWLFQRHRGTYEPTPQIPRGYYSFTGYAAQRESEGTPGSSSPDSQTLDVAALYFLENAGRDGFSGFLASDAIENEFLLSSAQKMLVGYPVNGISPTNQGRMHATPSANVTFSLAFERTYKTTDIRSSGGMSGGPLCIQFGNGNFYPAAIYLGGTGQTIVRSIDSDVIRMFSRAEASGVAGVTADDDIMHTLAPSLGANPAPASIKVTILPAAASAGRWKLQGEPESAFRSTSETLPGLFAGDYILQLKPISGFQTPASQTVSLVAGEQKVISVTYNEADIAPTISDITNKTINEDTATATIDLTVGDVETDAALLTLSGTSSNTALVPDANIVFGGSGASRTVKVTPAANQSGTATITLTVSDGTTGSSDTFDLTVTPVNDMPTISDVADMATNEDTATAEIPFTVRDDDPSDALTVWGSSTNIGLVPNENIVISGSGANRTVTVTPAPNKTGSVRIVLNANDGKVTAQDSFILTVMPVNDAPTISDVADKTIMEDKTTWGIAFTVRDVDTKFTSLTLSGTSSNTTLVPDANIVFGGTFAKRTVKVTPAANQSGTTTITVTVSDGSTSRSDTFVLTVTPVNDMPTISDVADMATNEDTATAEIPFTVQDDDPSDSLTVWGLSNDTALVPNENIVISGIGSNRTVTVTPAPNKTGSVRIVLGSNDGRVTAKESFILTVMPVNDAPTISDVADKTIIENKTTWGIAFTVGDVDTKVTSLTLSGTSSNTTLVPDANIVFGGTFAKRTVKVTPAANQSGTTTITVTVSDGTLTTVDTFVLSVTASAPVAKASLPLLPMGPASGIPSVSSESTGSQLLREAVATVELVDGLKYRALTITKSPGGLYFQPAVEVSPNLLDWYSGEKHTTVMRDDELLLKVRDNTPLAPGIKRFIRLKVKGD